MKTIHEITRESWILANFPEWGTWLNEEIDSEIVEAGTFSMWWLGCTGLWIKSEGSTNVLIDLWCQSGKRTQTQPYMKDQHQMQRMAGVRKLQPNLRNVPCVIDPFAIRNLNALLATHDHGDHIDINVAAAILQNCDKDVPFVGPEACIKLWRKWGVPEDRCILMHPGKSIQIKDIEIHAVEAFDRTALITAPAGTTLKGKLPPDMDKKAVNYVIKTPGGTVYHAGDSHFSNYFARHGNDFDIDVALGCYGENPRGITDKMTSVDILRMAECLNTKVVIPIHHDIWTNFQADPKEILALWKLRRYRLQYSFIPYIWQVGGKFTFPDDKNKREYHYPRGFDDAFSMDPDLPFLSFL